MQQVNLNTSTNTYQTTSAKTSKYADANQTDFTEMILGNKQSTKTDKTSSTDEKAPVKNQDSKASEKTKDASKVEEKEIKETKETKDLSKDELSAEWLFQMQTMGLQVVQQDSESLEQVSDVFSELQIEAVDVSAEFLPQTAEQMPMVEQSTDVAMSTPELPQENFPMENAEVLESVGVPEILETDAQVEVSSSGSVASVETLSEESVFSEKTVVETEAVVTEPQLEQVQDSSSEESQSTFDLETQTQQTNEVTAQSVSKEEKDNKTDGEFHEELSFQQMQGQNLRMQNTFTEQTQETTATLKTTEQNLPEDLGSKLAQSLPDQDGVLTIELEPASLGKLTIQVVYEEGRTAVSIFASNPKTLEMLSENAGEIAQILEDKTGQEVTIYTPEAEKEWQEQPEHQEKQNPREQEPQDRKRQSEPDSFAQQLRLGLV